MSESAFMVGGLGVVMPIIYEILTKNAFTDEEAVFFHKEIFSENTEIYLSISMALKTVCIFLEYSFSHVFKIIKNSGRSFTCYICGVN